MNLIAAVDKNWAIGKNNELLVSIPNDRSKVPSSCTVSRKCWKS